VFLFACANVEKIEKSLKSEIGKDHKNNCKTKQKKPKI